MERPQNTSSLKQLSKIASAVHMLYRLARELLYLDSTYVVLPAVEGSNIVLAWEFFFSGSVLCMTS